MEKISRLWWDVWHYLIHGSGRKRYFITFIDDCWVFKGIIQDKVEKEDLKIKPNHLVHPPQPHTTTHSTNMVTLSYIRCPLAPSPPKEVVEHWFNKYFQNQFKKMYASVDVGTTDNRRPIQQIIDELEEYKQPPRTPFLLSDYIQWGKFTEIERKRRLLAVRHSTSSKCVSTGRTEIVRECIATSGTLKSEGESSDSDPCFKLPTVKAGASVKDFDKGALESKEELQSAPQSPREKEGGEEIR